MSVVTVACNTSSISLTAGGYVDVTFTLPAGYFSAGWFVRSTKPASNITTLQDSTQTSVSYPPQSPSSYYPATFELSNWTGSTGYTGGTTYSYPDPACFVALSDSQLGDVNALSVVASTTLYVRITSFNSCNETITGFDLVLVPSLVPVPTATSADGWETVTSMATCTLTYDYSGTDYSYIDGSTPGSPYVPAVIITDAWDIAPSQLGNVGQVVANSAGVSIGIPAYLNFTSGAQDSNTVVATRITYTAPTITSGNPPGTLFFANAFTGVVTLTIQYDVRKTWNSATQSFGYYCVVLPGYTFTWSVTSSGTAAGAVTNNPVIASGSVLVGATYSVSTVGTLTLTQSPPALSNVGARFYLGLTKSATVALQGADCAVSLLTIDTLNWTPKTFNSVVNSNDFYPYIATFQASPASLAIVNGLGYVPFGVGPQYVQMKQSAQLTVDASLSMQAHIYGAVIKGDQAFGSSISMVSGGGNALLYHNLDILNLASSDGNYNYTVEIGLFSLSYIIGQKFVENLPASNFGSSYYYVPPSPFPSSVPPLPTTDRAIYSQIQLEINPADQTTYHTSVGYASLYDQLTSYPATTFAHTTSVVVDNFSDTSYWHGINATITGNMVVTATAGGAIAQRDIAYGRDFRNFRYLTISITANTTGGTLVFRLVDRQWTIGSVTSGTHNYVVDLCSPDNGVSVDYTTSAWQVPTGTIYGVSGVNYIQFSGIASGQVLTFNSLTLSRVQTAAPGWVIPENDFPLFDAPQQPGETAAQVMSAWFSPDPGVFFNGSVVELLTSPNHAAYQRLLHNHCDGKLCADIPFGIGYIKNALVTNLTAATLPNLVMPESLITLTDMIAICNNNPGLSATTPGSWPNQQTVYSNSDFYAQGSTHTLYDNSWYARDVTMDVVGLSTVTPASTNTDMTSANLTVNPTFRAISLYAGQQSALVLPFALRVWNAPQGTILVAPGQSPSGVGITCSVPNDPATTAMLPEPIALADTYGWFRFIPWRYLNVNLQANKSATTGNVSGSVTSVVTGGPGSNIAIFDTSKTWTANQWVGATATITWNSGAQYVSAVVVSNTTDAFVIAPQVFVPYLPATYTIVPPGPTGVMHLNQFEYKWVGLLSSGTGSVGTQPGSGYIKILRDYTQILVIIYTTIGGTLAVNVYGPGDTSPVGYTVDGNTTCTYPNIDLVVDTMVATYLRTIGEDSLLSQGSNMWMATSTTHGESWNIVEIPYPNTWSAGYTALSGVAWNSRYFALGFHTITSGDAPTGWYLTVGVLGSNGTYTFQTNTTAIPLVNPQGISGDLRVRDDGVLEFGWIDTTGQIYVTRGRGISDAGVGTWA